MELQHPTLSSAHIHLNSTPKEKNSFCHFLSFEEQSGFLVWQWSSFLSYNPLISSVFRVPWHCVSRKSTAWFVSMPTGPVEMLEPSRGLFICCHWVQRAGTLTVHSMMNPTISTLLHISSSQIDNLLCTGSRKFIKEDIEDLEPQYRI